MSRSNELVELHFTGAMRKVAEKHVLMACGLTEE